MKYFTLRATTEEQKANQALQLRLLQVFAIIFMTVAVIIIAFNALFINQPWQKLQDFMFAPCIIVLINLVPSVMKYSWKVIVPQAVIQTVVVTIFIIALHQIW